jgi:hypothetical protein
VRRALAGFIGEQELELLPDPGSDLLEVRHE